MTVNLSVDFLGSAELGQWIAVETAFIEPGRALDFAQCFITGDGKPRARANATFRVRMKGA